MAVSVSPVPVGNLPDEVTSFVGRRCELAEVRRLLCVARLVTLVGAGGVGKTRLALRVAQDLQHVFSDGVWRVDVAARQDVELLASTVSDALGIGERSNRSRIDVLVEYLGDRQLLLVLDNCDHQLEACAMLARRLLVAAPGLRILATSRQVLEAGGEHILPVPGLSVPNPDGLPASELCQVEAVSLFVQRAAEAVPGFVINDANVRVVTSICRRLDGIPLAIELAAVRLRTLPIEHILNRLDDRFSLLTDGSPTSALPRHRTLRATIDWSFEQCSYPERLLWARASVFAGDFDIEAAEEVCSGDGIGREDILDLVTALVDKSILAQLRGESRGRYRLLETVRQYGKERLISLGQERALLLRHRDYFRHLAAEAEAGWSTPRQVEWLRRLKDEQTNLRAALDFCVTEPGEAGAALEIAGSMPHQWAESGSFYERRHWLDRALALDSSPSTARAKALWVNGWLAVQQGEVDTGLSLLEESRDLAQRLGDESDFSYANQWIGYAAMMSGDLPRAATLLQEVLDRHRAAEDMAGVIVALYHLALCTTFLGDPRAGAIGDELLRLSEERHTDWFRPWALWAVGVHLCRQGDPRRATTLLRDSLRLRRDFNDRWGIALSIEGLAWTAAEDGQWERAARLLAAAGTFWRTVGLSPRMHAHYREPHDQCTAQARRVLGDDAFTAAYQAGATLPFDQAIADALEETPQRAETAPPAHRTTTALTPRELEVAQLVAQGLSNKDIAATLLITQRTAETHIEHILLKLGFARRTQIAAWVRRAH